jgi:DNA-binding response OmpR family regulator
VFSRHVSVLTTPVILVIDYHPESRHLLVRTLRRKYPQAKLLESDDAENALAIAASPDLSVIVTHRTFEVSGVELVRALRAVNATVPILMVSGMDRQTAALAAGANAFLHYDEWLRVGTVVEELLGRSDPPPRASKDL